MMEKVFILSFIVWAIYISMSESMIFERLGDYLDSKLPDYWGKPVFSCPVCMGGIYGAVLYWIIYGNNVKEWLVVNLAVIGLNAILVKLMPDKQ